MLLLHWPCLTSIHHATSDTAPKDFTFQIEECSFESQIEDNSLNFLQPLLPSQPPPSLLHRLYLTCRPSKKTPPHFHQFRYRGSILLVFRALGASPICYTIQYNLFSPNVKLWRLTVMSNLSCNSWIYQVWAHLACKDMNLSFKKKFSSFTLISIPLFILQSINFITSHCLQFLSIFHQ
jgi:hypothetical protein